MERKQLRIFSAHKPKFQRTKPTKYSPMYGAPDYSVFCFREKTENIIREGVEKEYCVVAYHANGDIYIGEKYGLIDITNRRFVSLLNHSYIWNEILIDEILHVIRIYIDEKR